MNECVFNNQKSFSDKKAFYFLRARGHDYSNYARAKGIVKLIMLDFSDCVLVDFGVEYHGHSLSKNKVVAFFQLAFSQILNKARVKKWMKRTSANPDIIFSTFMAKSTMKYLKKYCAKKSIPLVCDYTEWNTADEKRLGRFSRSLRACQYAITKWMDPSLNAVGISTYFTNYFSGKNINCIRLPNMLDCEKLTYMDNDSSKDRQLELLFVGNKNRIDFVNVLIDALASLTNDELSRVHTTIIGSDLSPKSKSPVNVKNLQKVSKNLSVFDRKPYSEFEKFYYRSDFSIFLLSTKLLYAKALFPTKMTDAFAHSRPVMSNLTTDLPLYLADGENSLICKGDDASALAETIRRGLKLTKTEKEKMNESAFKTICSQFDYHCFREPFVSFVKKAIFKEGGCYGK